MISITDTQAEIFIISAAIVSILFGLLNAFLITRIKVVSPEYQQMAYKDDKQLAKF